MGHLVQNDITKEIFKKHKIPKFEIARALSVSDSFVGAYDDLSLEKAVQNYRIAVSWYGKIVAIKQIYNHYLHKCGQKER